MVHAGQRCEWARDINRLLPEHTFTPQVRQSGLLHFNVQLPTC